MTILTAHNDKYRILRYYYTWYDTVRHGTGNAVKGNRIFKHTATEQAAVFGVTMC